MVRLVFDTTSAESVAKSQVVSITSWNFYMSTFVIIERFAYYSILS